MVFKVFSSKQAIQFHFGCPDWRIVVEFIQQILRKWLRACLHGAGGTPGQGNPLTTLPSRVQFVKLISLVVAINVNKTKWRAKDVFWGPKAFLSGLT